VKEKKKLLPLNLCTYKTWNSMEARKKMLSMNLRTYRTWNSIKAKEKENVAIEASCL
jgi:hypothetical protein